MRNYSCPKMIPLFLGLSFLVTCTEPVTPEFEFVAGLIAVEGFVSNVPGGSFVKINEINEFNIGVNRYVNVFVSGALVSFVNTDTGETVSLGEDEDAGMYVPPSDFAGLSGETWELDILLDDGTHYKSLPETMAEGVPILAVDATYDPQLSYNIALNDYAPGHSIEVDFDDPLESGNQYYWTYRSFELRAICKTCYEVKFYRDGECVLAIPDPLPGHVELYPYWTYSCASDCWQIRYNQNINIFSDKFTNGSSFRQLPVAVVPLNTKRDILVELLQISLSPLAYEYYETLKDIIDDNGGFNSPPSAALVGNMFNPDNRGEFVLGRFTAAPTEIERIFITRSHLEETQIELEFPKPEGEPPPPGLPPEEWVFYAPCPEESRYNTSIKPEGWPE